jgi:hypothetical protein
MKWSVLCSKLGIPKNVSIGTEPPMNMIVIDARLLEEMLLISDEELNTAFCILESDSISDTDEEIERILEEDYDW